MKLKKVKSLLIFITALAFMAGSAFFTAGCGGGSGDKPAAKTEAKDLKKFPDKPIKMVVPHGIGGSVDVNTRALMPFLEKQLGVPVVVENIGEAGGRKAREQVFKSSPDGYTLMVLLTPSTQVGEVMYAPGYETSKYTYLCNVFGQNYKVVAVASDSPYKTFDELLKASKEKPLNVGGGGGVGSSAHLQSILLDNSIGFKHNYVPYEGTSTIVMALLGKHVEAALNDMSGLYTSRDKVRILALHAPKRDPLIPDVPTLDELGYKGLVIPWMIGFVAPPGLPGDIQEVLVKAFAEAIKSPDFVQWSEKSGNRVEYMVPEEFKKVSEDNLKQVKSVESILNKGK